MQTTLDLPDHLIQQVKQRAQQQGRPIKELVADYIRQGLHGPAALPLTTNRGVLEVDAEGLPLYRPDPKLKRHSIDLASCHASFSAELQRSLQRSADRSAKASSANPSSAHGSSDGLETGHGVRLIGLAGRHLAIRPAC
ncbi:hypothetical protein [Vulcanococcus limneticus]|jgi:hypothetical protein|uniref:hypothetical protein n=1 Tax=Vulcanococcus limneticus TaxID=2170428 RepID=UPI00398C144B